MLSGAEEPSRTPDTDIEHDINDQHYATAPDHDRGPARCSAACFTLSRTAFGHAAYPGNRTTCTSKR
jgi:hypothetical protein